MKPASPSWRWLILAVAGPLCAAPADIAQTPLSVTQTVRPIVLLALSNDHQLYRKAYNDYSDLNGDGNIETTYDNGYDYYGYFDPDKCYTYSTSGYFSPSATATDHQCSGAWSGNLLNWASMTRIDVLRKVLYGGYRSLDTVGPDQTILERVLLPTDAHAFAKVFAPAEGATDMARYTPYGDEAAITFCNVTYSTSSTESQLLSTGTSPPLIRVARGLWPMWSAGEVVECAWTEEYSNVTAPSRSSYFKAQLNARVEVCVPGLIEENCRGYKDNSNVTHLKPIGLLQKYGDNGSLRFGLITGSYNKRMSGGVLRRKIGLIAGNSTANAALDEIDLKTGRFTGNNGIIKAINAFRINKYSFSGHKYTDCGTYGIPLCSLQPTASPCFKNGVCTNWGNPVAEIYTEALRYLAGKEVPYSTYDTSDASYFSVLTPITSWDDPVPDTEWCAKSNLIFISTGVNSFDRDELPTDLTGFNAGTATTAVGTAEGLGSTASIIHGGSGTVKQCTAKTTASMAAVQGVCPEGPTLEGGYLAAGAAHYSHTTGLRRVSDHQQVVNTQTVALARDLPRFNIAVGGSTVTLLPYMEANNSGTAVQATSGWRVGTLQDLVVENLIRDATGKLIGGSVLAIWEDSTWGNDYDMDGVQRIKFCAGSVACNQACASCIDCNNDCAACNDTLTACTAAYNSCVGAYNTCSTQLSSCRNACTSDNTTCTGICNTNKTNCNNTCTTNKTNCNTVCSTNYTACYTGCGGNKTCQNNCKVAQTNCTNACTATYNNVCTPACATAYSTCTGACTTTLNTCNAACTSAFTCTSCTNDCVTCTGRCACAGVCPTECTMNVNDNELQVTTSVPQANAGNALLFGYTVAGTQSGTTPANTNCDGAYHGDGVYREVVRAGGNNGSTLPPNTATSWSSKPADCIRKFAAGTNTAQLLEPPLWYAAKYGGFTDINANALPDQRTEWDANRDNVPDRFFYADNPALLGTSLERFLEIIATVSSSASVVANSITLNEDTRIFQGRYDSSDWSGDLVAFPINTDGSLSTLIWSGRTAIDTQSGTDTRRIITSNEDRLGRTGGPGVPFRWGNAQSDDDDGIADSQKLALRLQPCWGTNCLLEDAAKGEARLNYLRGSHAAETSHVGGTLRTRSHVMGDVVNSDPVYVGAPAALYPDDLEPEPYRTFAAAQARRQAAIYVGANDGMMHAFDADDGTELFGYVPRAVYPKLSAISALDYRDHHQSFVDSGPVAGDAYFENWNGGTGAWRTLLLGGLGAGGRGIYAIDVTDPTDFLGSEASAASRVLWDISGGDTGFADLGYTYSRPALVRLPDDLYDGVWAVVFGNGYESPQGRAVLYVVDARTGVLLTSLVVDQGPANGLSSVAPVDYDGDGRMDYLYAGDLQGNLWRFEPAGALGLKVSFGGEPLFNDFTGTGGTAAPITVRPEVMRHPTRGMMILFGTGAYYRISDRQPNTSVINAFYGVWDRLDGTSEIGRGDLLRQRILGETASGSFTVRVTSDYPINWRYTPGKPTDAHEITPTHLGWYLELRQPQDGAAQGEVQVTDPQLRGGRVIFTSLVPTDPAVALCDFGGDGWLTEINALNGARMSQVVFDLNADAVFNVADMVNIQVNGQPLAAAPSGKKSRVGIIQEPAIIGAGTREYKFASGAREAAIEVTLENPGGAAGGRRSWIQLH